MMKLCFFNCYLAAPRPTLGHSQGGSLTNPMLITAFLKLVSAIFYQIFIFSSNDSPSKTIKNVFYFIEKTLRSQDIQFFVIFSPPFHTFQIQKDKWKCSNL